MPLFSCLNIRCPLKLTSIKRIQNFLFFLILIIVAKGGKGIRPL